ncbi:single-stranded-DNA-specific exonuclease RecJ [Candidatus Riflebacteria bacterium]
MIKKSPFYFVEFPAQKKKHEGSFSYTFEQILKNREIIDPGEKSSFFQPTLTDLQSPYLFKSMERIIDRLKDANLKNEKILISSDRDVDGLTSTTLLIKAFDWVGWKHPEVFFPDIEMGNGLNESVIKRFAAENGRIIITCDCGIRNIQEAQQCLDLGIELIITDHHIAAEIPQAFAILNPKIPDSPPDFKELAACGVAFKLACAIILSQKKEHNQVIPFLRLDSGKKLHASFVKNGVLLNKELIAEDDIEFKNFILKSQLAFYIFPRDYSVIYHKLKRLGIRLNLQDFQTFYKKVYNLKYFPGAKSLSRHFHFSTGLESEKYRFCPVEICSRAFGRIWCHRYKPIRLFCEEVLDTLAIGTIGDLVPLKGENRIYVKLGLKILERSKNPGLAELIKLTHLNGRAIANKDVATQLIPYLNSPGRLGQGKKSLELLLLKDTTNVNRLMDEIHFFNSKRKEMTYNTYKACRQILTKNPKLLKNPVVILCRYKSIPGVSGIVAAKLAKEFQKPIIIITVSDGIGTASCRTCNNYNIYSALIHCQGLLLAYGGHPFAAGFTIEEKDIPEFSKKVNEFAKDAPELLSGEKPKVTVDAIVKLDEIDKNFLKSLSQLKPFGIGNPNPIFFSSNITVQNFSRVGSESNNILFEFKTKRHPRIEGLCLNKAHVLKDLPSRLKKIDILYTIEMKSHSFSIPKLRIMDFALSPGDR